MKTRKINETPILEQATAETNVLVEQNGTASRIPASALGGVDEKALVEKLAPAFTKTAPVVTCNPVVGYPLEVVSHIAYGRGQNIITDYTTSVDDYRDPTMVIDLPAGKYILWYKGESELAVYANAEENRLVLIPATFDTAKETTIDHPGGLMLIADTSWMTAFNENNLVLAAVTESATSTTLTHNNKSVTANFPVAVSKGTFNWITGELTSVTSQPNLVADYKDDTKWCWDDPEDQMYWVYDIDLPSGDYTIFSNSDAELQAYMGDSWSTIKLLGVVEEYSTTTFYHDGGKLRIVDVFDSHRQDDYVLKLVAGTEYVEDYSTTHQLTPIEIVGLGGTNTLSSSTGDTEVSGRADPTFIINDLYSKVNA